MNRMKFFTLLGQKKKATVVHEVRNEGKEAIPKEIINRRREFVKGLAGVPFLPSDGFRFAFENGADFICVGMFDFQVVENVNSANKILGELKKREREWFS